MLNVLSHLLLSILKSQKSPNPLLSHSLPLNFHFLWFGHLVGPIMGVFCLDRRLFLLFHLFIFFHHMATSEGVIPTSEGGLLTSEGVILTKQAIFGPYFARMRTLQTQNSHQSVLFAPKTPCFGDKSDFYSYPTDIPTHREVFWCIGIMVLGSKIQRRGVTLGSRQSAILQLNSRDGLYCFVKSFTMWRS
jgi:hypothetical protein